MRGKNLLQEPKCLAPREPRNKGLLANGQETKVGRPASLDPKVEVPLALTGVQERHAAAATETRADRTKDHDRELALFIGVALGEAETLLVERRAQALAIHHSEHLVGRSVAVQMDVLELHLAILADDALATLDRPELGLLVMVAHPVKRGTELRVGGLEILDQGGERFDDHQDTRHLVNEIRLIEQTPKIVNRATLLQDSVDEHPHDLERESKVAEHTPQILLFLTSHSVNLE